MANEFKIRKGLIVNGSGSTTLDIQGTQGQLFSVTDDLSGSLFSVNDISGIPIMEVFSDEVINMGTFGAEALIVSGSTTTISDVNATGSFSGSLAAPGSNGQILYNSGSLLQASSDVYYDEVNGRVGIGTTLPEALLHITPPLNTAPQLLLIDGYDNDGTKPPVVIMRDENSNIDFSLTPTDGGFFRNLEVDAIQINNGPVSIGQAHSFPGTQTRPLNIVQETTESQLRLLSSTSVNAGDNISGIEFYADTARSSQNHILGNLYAESEGYTTGVSYPTSFVFALAGTNENSPSERVRITGDGNLGIGTTSPSTKLHVSGSTTITEILTLEPLDTLPTPAATGSFAISGSTPPKPYFWDGSTWNALY